MAYKITFFFEGVQAATRYASAAVGWTETFYLNKPGLGSVDAALLDVDTQSYVTLRRRCLHGVYRIAFVRASDDSNPRLFKVMAPSNATGVLNLSRAAGGSTVLIPAQVQCGVLVDLVRLPTAPNEPTHHRKFILRGLPTTVIDGNILVDTAPEFNAIKTFFNWLAFKELGDVNPGLPNGIPQNTGLGLRYHDPAVDYFRPASLMPDTDDNHLLKVFPALPVPVGGGRPPQYEIRDAPAPLKRFNRVWTYIEKALDGSYTKVGRSRDVLGTDGFIGVGRTRMRLIAWLYGLFSQYTIIGVRSKKTGRLFRQLRGRASNRS